MVVSMSKYDDEPRVCKACADANDPAKLRAELASMRASTDALAEALQMLLDAVNGHRVTVGDCNEASAALAAAQSNKGEAS
jgi:hypothetical protein